MVLRKRKIVVLELLKPFCVPNFDGPCNMTCQNMILYQKKLDFVFFLAGEKIFQLI